MNPDRTLRAVARACGWPVSRWSMWVIGATVLAGTVLYALLAPQSGPKGDQLLETLDVLTGTLALGVATLLIARFRWTSDVVGLRIGLGFAAIGLWRIVVHLFLPLGGPGFPGLEAALRFGGRALALVALVGALLSPEMGVRLRPRRLVLIGGVTLVAVLLTSLVGSETDVIAGDVDLTAASVAHLFVMGSLSIVWFLLAVPYLLIGLRRGRSLLVWFGSSFAVIGIAQLLSLPATLAPELPLPLPLPAVVRTVGFVFAFAGVLAELRSLYASQGLQLRETTLAVGTLEKEVLSERELREELAHEARNAVQTIGVAVRTLEQHRSALDPESRIRLESAASSGIERLRLLLGPVASEAVPSFDLEEVVGPLVHMMQADGTELRHECAPGTFVVGRPEEVAQIVHNLLVNARRHAPGSPVDLRVERSRDRILLSVADRGPGVPQEDHARIFERGWRGGIGGAGGRGLGLYVSARLARDQGGELWIEDREDGGACFVLSLLSGEGRSPG